MSGLPWPVYHAKTWGDYSTLWGWIDDGGDIRDYGGEETEVIIKMKLPHSVMTHTDRIVEYVREHYYEEFSDYDVEMLDTDGEWECYDEPADEVDGVVTAWYHPPRFWFTWDDLADTALEQIRDRSDVSGIPQYAWDEDAVDYAGW